MAVIGAGAAGTMAAIWAATGGADVVLLERTRDGGRKILIAGGGRCNVLPARLDERRFITDSSPHTLRNMVRSWPLAEQVAFFEREVGIPLKEEAESAKLFPASDRARDVRDGLLRVAHARGVRVRMGVTVTGLERGTAATWRVLLQDGAPLEADRVIVATGGLSVPATGSDGTGLRLLAQLGHAVHPTYPALTPITCDPPEFGVLAGISFPVAVAARSADRAAEAMGGFLFTRHGYSGPAVLDVSHVLVRARLDGRPATLRARWTAHDDAAWDAMLRAGGSRTAGGVVRRELPERLADLLLGRAGVEPGRPLAQLTREARRRLVDELARCDLPWTGDEGYKKAEVTGGGVALGEVHPRTMESRRSPGLFLCGEVLDAFGPIGGYNFLWAWATGRAAGLGAAGPVTSTP